MKLGAGNRNRWGDYSATAVDPVNDLDFWTLQEFASAIPDDWGTWWGRIVVSGCAGPPASPGTSLRAVKRGAGAALSWDPAAGADSYAVLRCDAGALRPCTPAGLDGTNGTTLVDAAVPFGHAWYRVETVNPCGVTP